MSDITTEKFCQMLKEYCLEHGFIIVGTCVAEGITGEIQVLGVDVADPDAFNFAYPNGEPVKV